MFKSKRWQSEVDGGREKKRTMGEGELVLEPCSDGRVVGVCKDLKYVEEMRVLSFLLATGHPVPPLAVCRQQFISGPGRSSKRKWEEIWSIWWHYKAHADLRASSKPGQGFITTDDWHPPLTPGHCTLNFSASPQQHQLSARSLKLILLREVS